MPESLVVENQYQAHTHIHASEPDADCQGECEPDCESPQIAAASKTAERIVETSELSDESIRDTRVCGGGASSGLLSPLLFKIRGIFGLSLGYAVIALLAIAD